MERKKKIKYHSQKMLLIKNGRIIDPSQNLDRVADLLVEDGKITAIESQIENSQAEVIDAKGLIVSPGLLDIHVHGRTPGQEYKEDTSTLTAAAARGGVTTVCVMPNTNPTLDKRSVLEDVVQRSHTEGNGVRVLPIASVSIDAKNEQLSEFSELKEAGAVAVSDDAFPIQDAGFMRRVFEYAKTYDLVTLLHCEETTLTGGGHAGVGKGGGMMNEGLASTEMGLRGMPRVSEEIAVFKACALAKEIGNKLHILHVSTAGGVEQIRAFKAQGTLVTGEACPHHFALTDEACRGYNTDAKMNPPLRTQEDVDAIIVGLKDGTLDAIATDHAPHAAFEKEQEFDRAPFGIIGLETMLPLSLKVLSEHLSLSEIIGKMTHSAAQVLALEFGTLQLGAPADITIFNASEKWVLDKNQLASKSKNTPFHGHEMIGKVYATIVDGKFIHREES